MKSGLHGEPVGVPIRMSAKPVERRFSWGHITSFGGGLQLIEYVGKFLKLAPFHTDPIFPEERLAAYFMGFQHLTDFPVLKRREIRFCSVADRL
jgi:hypothetical protein